MMKKNSLSYAWLGTSVLLSGLIVAVPVSAKTTISYQGWSTAPSHVQVHKTLFALFEKQHPDIKVLNQNTGYLGDMGHFSQFATRAAGGVAPDVVCVPYSMLPRMAESGLLADISSLLASDKTVKASDWSPANLGAGRWKGKLWALPWAGTDFWVTYSSRGFAEAGLQDPEQTYESGSWSMDTMEAAAAKLTKFDGQKCTKIGLLTLADSLGLSAWLTGWGLDFFDEASNTCVIDSEAGVAAFTHIYDLLYSKKSTSFHGGFPRGITYDQPTKYGMIAIMRNITSNLESLKSKLSFNQVPFPAGPLSNQNNAALFHVLSISKQSKNRQAAWELVKFMCGKEAAAILQRDVQWQSPRKDSIKQLADIFVGMGYTGDRFSADADARVRLIARASRSDVIFPKIEGQLSRGWTKKLDMPLAVKAAAREANLIMARKK